MCASRSAATLARALGIAALLLLATPSASADSLECPGGIVSVGDLKVELLAKCGAPALREERFDTRAGELGTTARRVDLVVEQWTYNFGPRRFIQVVTIERGKVVAIERGSYGYDPEKIEAAAESVGRARCEPGTLRVGDRKLDAIAKCGEPRTRDSWEEKRPVLDAGTGAHTAWQVVTVESWTYDHGPRRFIEVVTLENGVITRIDRGGYGYAEQ